MSLEHVKQPATDWIIYEGARLPPCLSKQYQCHPSVKEKPPKARQNQHPDFLPLSTPPKYPFARQKRQAKTILTAAQPPPLRRVTPSVARRLQVEAVEQLDVEEGALSRHN